MRVVVLFLLFSALDGSFSQQYVYVNTHMSWFAAQSYCREYYRDLATFKDVNDYNEVVTVLTGEWCWIGLFRLNSQSAWTWSDQSNFTFSHWYPGEPNNMLSSQICTAMSKDGWYDHTCPSLSPFICFSDHKDKKQQVLRVEVKSDGNVNDPEVQQNVLEKIQHILNMKIWEGNATLSWRNQSDGNVFQRNLQNNATQHTCY